MEEKIQLNFSVPVELSLEIDSLLIALKKKGSIKLEKRKPEFLVELLYLGCKAKSKDL